ncbi:hypothetical protein WN51_02960 [Melipona quadrifasciata]|uniref:Uncharacterized protein n=1 Tax=Melipona quadrifasciata TaxID=166423 RepID=A0A0M8ZYH3_9HYME|nr:hypothetical protein WN51_02960 [Melipona quadrifasciata]
MGSPSGNNMFAPLYETGFSRSKTCIFPALSPHTSNPSYKTAAVNQRSRLYGNKHTDSTVINPVQNKNIKMK